MRESMSQKNGHVGVPNELSVTAYFQQLSSIVPRLPYGDMDKIVDLIMGAFDAGRTIYVFGNGGSAASASHMMCDMNKGTVHAGHPNRLKVLALTDNVPLLTAWANDSSYENVFAEQLKNFARRGDVAFAISGSGNSANVLLALKAARELGASTAGVAGYQGGKMKALCDVCAVVPSDNMQMIEDMHHAMLHSLFTVVSQRIRSRQPQMRSTGAGILQE